MIRKILKSKRAEGYIDVVIGVVALVMFIVIALNIFTFVTLKTTMDRIADDLIETATFSGSFGASFEEKLEQLQAKYFDFEVETYVEKYYNAENKKVQIGDDMGFTIRVNASVAGIGIALPIDISVSRVGQSEQYWKPATGIYETPPIEDDSWKPTFVVNIKTHKFHYPACSSLSSLAPTHRLDIQSTVTELKELGYNPCGICDPHDCTIGTIAFFNNEEHWGYCEVCNTVGKTERHTFAYSVELLCYHCTDCGVIVDGETIRCLKGTALTNESHKIDCDCVAIEPVPDGNLIPAGATYLAADGTQYAAGSAFPTITIGDKYTQGDYEYCYGYAFCKDGVWSNECGCNKTIVGWGVKCINDTAEPGKVLQTVNGELVVSMAYAFYEYTTLTTAPAIPEGVADLTSTFQGCTSLVIAPQIPVTVTNMNGTFFGCAALTTGSNIPVNVTDIKYAYYKCESLTGTIVIDASPSVYSSCFALSSAGQDITLTGASSKLKAIANTSTKGKRVVYDIEGNILKQ